MGISRYVLKEKAISDRYYGHLEVINAFLNRFTPKDAPLNGYKYKLASTKAYYYESDTYDITWNQLSSTGITAFTSTIDDMTLTKSYRCDFVSLSYLKWNYSTFIVEGNTKYGVAHYCYYDANGLHKNVSAEDYNNLR